MYIIDKWLEKNKEYQKISSVKLRCEISWSITIVELQWELLGELRIPMWGSDMNSPVIIIYV